MTKCAVVFSVAALLLIAPFSVQAAQTIYGVSGLIEVPDDTIVAPSSVALTVHYADDVTGDGDSLLSFGGAIGLIPKLEVSAVGVDVDVPGFDTEVVFNGKYRLLDETVESPSVTIGVVDVASNISDDPSFFVVVGKNITASAEDVTGDIRSLRGYIGTGTDIYGGIFAGLDWSVAPQFNVLLEYLSDGLRDDSTFNAALRYNPVGPLSLQAGTLDFEGFYVGGTFNWTRF